MEGKKVEIWWETEFHCRDTDEEGTTTNVIATQVRGRVSGLQCSFGNLMMALQLSSFSGSQLVTGELKSSLDTCWRLQEVNWCLQILFQTIRHPGTCFRQRCLVSRLKVFLIDEKRVTNPRPDTQDISTPLAQGFPSYSETSPSCHTIFERKKLVEMHAIGKPKRDMEHTDGKMRGDMEALVCHG